MTDQERLDAIDEHVDKARNLSAGLKEDGRPEEPVGSSGSPSADNS